MDSGLRQHQDLRIPKDAKARMLHLLYGALEEAELGSGKLAAGRLAGDVCKRFLFLKGRRVDFSRPYGLRDLELEAVAADGADLLLLTDAGCEILHRNREHMRDGSYRRFSDSLNAVLSSVGAGCRLSGGRLSYGHMIPPPLPEGACGAAQEALEDAYGSLRSGMASSAVARAEDALREVSSADADTASAVLSAVSSLDREDMVSARYAVDILAASVLFIVSGGGERVKDVRGFL